MYSSWLSNIEFYKLNLVICWFQFLLVFTFKFRYQILNANILSWINDHYLGLFAGKGTGDSGGGGGGYK